MTQCDLFRTLADAREEYRHGIAEGTHCPCCDRWGKVYKRHLGASMAKALVLIYRWAAEQPEGAYLHVTNYLHRHPEATAATRGDFTKLRHWGFLERNPKAAGEWRITDDGRQFALGIRPAPPWVGEYEGECVAMPPLSEPVVFIEQIQGKGFDYERLMSEPCFIEGGDA